MKLVMTTFDCLFTNNQDNLRQNDFAMAEISLSY